MMVNNAPNYMCCVRTGYEKRIVGLDLMRILLAIQIFMFHSQMHYNCNYSYLNYFVRMGAIAMTGFMLLSGYVLYTSYSKKDLTKIGEIKAFYMKRLISILPLYYTIALLHVVYQLLVGAIALKEVCVLFPVELFSVQSTYFSLFNYSHNNGTWFISCILLCYAVYPYIQTLISQISNKKKRLMLLMICGLLLYAPFVGMFFHLSWVNIYANPFYRILEFTIGVILSQMVNADHKHRIWNLLVNPISLMLSLIILVLSVSVLRYYYHSDDYMLFNWIALPCYAVMILNLGTVKLRSAQVSKVLIYLSSISLAFFLCQVLPLWSASHTICSLIGSNSNIVKIAVSFSLCLIVAISIHEVIEKPSSRFLRMKLLG